MKSEYFSTRNVAEYAYCPRLFYFLAVDGIFISNEDTEKGHLVHKRVDKPSLMEDLEEEEEETQDNGEEKPPKVIRSLALSSEKLGISAKLDLVEIQNKSAVPLEYRKGRPYHAPVDPAVEEEDAPYPVLPTAQPWPTDRVQVGLQALLLEEVGFEVKKAVLYYAEEKRQLTLLVTEELKREAIEVLEKAKKCAGGDRPPPLVNDPKCERCSLLSFCLPDEIHFEKQGEPEKEKPREFWLPKQDGIQIVAQTEGSRIGVSGLSLKVTGKRGEKISEIPLANVEGLALLGNVQITTQALRVLADRGVPVAFLSAAGRLCAIVDPLDAVSSRIRRAQVLKLENEQAVLELSKALVAAKIANQRTFLMRNHNDLPEVVSREMEQMAKQALETDAVEKLRGYEGQAAALYFQNFSGMLKGPLAEEFQDHGRKRRPPPDPVNACLSFGYAMLVNECISALRLARLEPTLGAYHRPRPGRPSLALDLMEPFRPLIADSVVIGLFNRGELASGHFLRTSAGCVLTDAGRKAFFNAYGRRMITQVTHDVFGYRLSYRRQIYLHARLIAAWMEGEVPKLSFLRTR